MRRSPLYALSALVLPLVASCGSAAPSVPPVAQAPAPPPSVLAPVTRPSATGIWLGTLHAGGKGLRVQLHLDLEAHPPSASLDSLDQGAMGLAGANVFVAGNALSLDVPAVGGKLQATLSADGSALEGSWTQAGTNLGLSLQRQVKAIGPVELAFDPALPKVSLAGLREVLDGDLAATLASGDLAPATGGGVTIGVVLHGERLVLSYGSAKVDSVYEIGSVTKTFTGLLLAQLVTQKKATLDEPVRALLPPGTVSAPPSGPEISLLDLSAQCSGLPRMPDNFAPADPTNPYADYDVARLYAFLGKHGVGRPDQPAPLYSNLGVGLLGQALANRAHGTYAALVQEQILGPLGMHDTGVVLTPSMRPRFLQGHDEQHRPAHAWDLGALGGAGGLRSTAADMLVYLEAQLHPEHLPPSARSTAAGRTLAAAIPLSHELRGDFGPGNRIALNWLYAQKRKAFWHNGGTGGFSSFVSFVPEEDCAIVVLSNTSPRGEGSLADNLGLHLEARLQGRPAISLKQPAPAQ